MSWADPDSYLETPLVRKSHWLSTTPLWHKRLRQLLALLQQQETRRKSPSPYQVWTTLSDSAPSNITAQVHSCFQKERKSQVSIDRYTFFISSKVKKEKKKWKNSDVIIVRPSISLESTQHIKIRRSPLLAVMSDTPASWSILAPHLTGAAHTSAGEMCCLHVVEVSYGRCLPALQKQPAGQD